MRIFLTGATGYIGSAVCRSLIGAGHEVLGLTRSKDKAGTLAAWGARAVAGDINEPRSWREEAARCDVLIHAAVEYGPGGPRADKAALEGLIRAGKRLIYTSGVWVLGTQKGAAADEEAPLAPLPIVAWRPAHEALALDASGIVVRPGCVYGGRRGLYGAMIKAAVEERSIPLAGEGTNCWAAVYLDDLAELYRSIVEQDPPEGVYHATDGTPEPLKEVARALLDAAGGGAVRSDLSGPLAQALALDQRVSSEKAGRVLGWRPKLRSVVRNAARLTAEWRQS